MEGHLLNSIQKGERDNVERTVEFMKEFTNSN